MTPMMMLMMIVAVELVAVAVVVVTIVVDRIPLHAVLHCYCRRFPETIRSNWMMIASSLRRDPCVVIEVVAMIGHDFVGPANSPKDLY